MSHEWSDFMSIKKEIKKEQIINNKVDELNKELSSMIIYNSLQDNINNMKKLFIDDDIFVLREVVNKFDQKQHYAIAYCNGLINNAIINDNIIKPLILSKLTINNTNTKLLIEQVLQINDIKTTNQMKDIIENVEYGDVILFIDGCAEALILDTKQFQLRSIMEPESEKIIVGPREGFTESIVVNTSMIRRKLRTNELKFKMLTIGEKSNTKVCLCYIDSIVDKNILDEIIKRLNKIKIDAVIDTNYITELTRDNPYSPFRTTGYSEKPDVIVGKILEGRIAIILDGTPAVLSIPYLFVENFQSGEDYYLSYYYTSFARVLRILGFLFTIFLPAFYVAIVAFHKEMLPTPLFISIAISRQSVPLPAALEMVVMLFVFDVLQETGVRMPSNIGQALSIVGAIVIGQASVEAKLVSAPMIIIVAFTGITNLLVPKLNAPVIYIRIILLILASSLGLFGFLIGVSLLFIHILNLKSFGVNQININGSLHFNNVKDALFRVPLWDMKKRPKVLSNNETRLKSTGVK
jgi:spore germination protein KA